jgi:hypothetical protein
MVFGCKMEGAMEDLPGLSLMYRNGRAGLRFIGFKLRNGATSRGIARSLSLRERVRVRGDPSKLTI